MDYLYDMVEERTNETEMAAQAAKPIERWMANRRVALVISNLAGETSVGDVEDWRESFLPDVEDACTVG